MTTEGTRAGGATGPAARSHAAERAGKTAEPPAKASKPWSILIPLRDGWKQLAETAQCIRGVSLIFWLLVLIGLLLGTNQGRDLAETLNEAGGVGIPVKAATLSGACLLLGLEAWFWARRIIDDRVTDWRDKRNTFLEWTPRVLGVAPFVLAAIAILRSGLQKGLSLPVLGFLLALGAGFGVLLYFRTTLLDRVGDRDRAIEKEKKLKRLAEAFSWAGVAAACIVLLVFILWPVGPARALGAIGVVYVGVAAIIAVLGKAIHDGNEWRLPVMGTLVVLAIGFSYFLPDNHAVGRRGWLLRPQIGAPTHRTTLRQAALDWYQAQDKAQPFAPKEVRPVVFVAAAGGASRAGYWAAEALGQLHEQTGGKFGPSVFLISSVSGGSVGATAFVSQMHEDPLDPKAFRTAIERVSEGDFLSPVVAGLLFPDLLQRFVPLGFPDRASALEHAFEAGWRDHCSDPSASAPSDGMVVCKRPDLWSMPFTTLADGAGAREPVLIINGARQEDGRRVLTSTVQINDAADSPNDFANAMDFISSVGDVPISTAIHNGARFPLVSPGGDMIDQNGRTHGHVIDGGYFENAGVTTVREAFEVFSKALSPEQRSHLQPIFIELNNQETSTHALVVSRGRAQSAAQLGYVEKSKYFLTDLLGPLNGLSSSRDSHETAAAAHFSQDVDTWGKATDLGGWGRAPAYALLHLCPPPKGHGIMPMDWALSKEATKFAQTALMGCDNAPNLTKVLDPYGVKPPKP